MNPSSRIINAENVIFQRRRNETKFDASWASFTNAASLVIGHFEDISIENLRDLFDPQTALQLVAAARVLDATSSEILEAPINQEQSGLGVVYAELAAAAFGMYGNFPAANAVCSRLLPFGQHLTAFQAACLCCCAPSLIGSLIKFTNEGPALAFVERLEAFLRTGETEREASAREAFLTLRQHAEAVFDEALWTACFVALEQTLGLSTLKTLARFDNSAFNAFALGLARDGIKTFLPPQFLALTRHSLLTRDGNALLALPTSTGKTLLSELLIFNAVKTVGRIGVFVVPYVALGRQVSDTAAKHLPTDWKVLRLFGGFKEPGAFEEFEHKTFVVATPERLDALLRFDPDIVDRLDCIVFDEAHMINNGQRGARLECLLARLLLFQERGSKFRLVFASAVVPNIKALAKWMDASEEHAVQYNWTPNAKRIAIWRDSGELTWYYSNDQISPHGVAADEPIFSIKLPWPRYISPRWGSYPETLALEPKNLDNIAYLCEYLWKKFEEPVLCVCPTKEITRKVAGVLRNRFDPGTPIRGVIRTAVDLIGTEYPYYTHLQSALERGIAYHNASLPHQLRGAIEDAAKAKALKIVLSTTTLAEGVDLPFRVTVLADWLGYKGKSQTPLSPLLVRNIAGRCGRVGYFTEGDVVVYDNPLGDRLFKRADLKNAYQRRVIFSEGDEGVTSAAADQLDEADISATIESQFLAAVSENPHQEDVEARFVDHLFATCLDKSQALATFVARVSTEMTSGQWQFASRSSPLVLTSLGTAVNKSGFSPSSCRRILDYLATGYQGGDDVEAGVALLSQLGDLAEQGDDKFAKLVQRHRDKTSSGTTKRGAPKTFVRIESLPDVLNAWLRGERPVDIFVKLPTVLKSARKPHVADWLKGTTELTSWDSEFDKFCDFLRATLFEFLPWLLRACGLLAPFASATLANEEEWKRIAERYHRDSAVTRREDTAPTTTA